MPSSLLALAPTIVAMAAEVRPRRVLDIGPGVGKYGLILREYLGSIDDPRDARGPLEVLDAVEAEDRYIDGFPWLADIYGVVIHGQAHELSDRTLADYDLVLMLDVIEHMEHMTARGLIARIPGRIIVSTPREYFQNPEAGRGWPTEDHRSHWTPDDFLLMGRPREVFDVDAYERLAAVLVRLGPLATP